MKWGVTQAVLELMAPASTDLCKQDGAALLGLAGMCSVSLVCRGVTGEGRARAEKWKEHGLWAAAVVSCPGLRSSSPGQHRCRPRSQQGVQEAPDTHPLSVFAGPRLHHQLPQEGDAQRLR